MNYPEFDPLPQKIAEKVMPGLGLKRWIDLVLHFPARYQDEATLSTYFDLVDNAKASLVGTLQASEIIERPRRQLVAKLSVDGGDIQLRWLHFYPGQQTKLVEGSLVKVTGATRKTRYGWEIIHPKMLFNPNPNELIGSITRIRNADLLEEANVSPYDGSKGSNSENTQDATLLAATAEPSQAKLTPVYPTVSGVKQTDFARWLKQAPAECFVDLLPASWWPHFPLPRWPEAVSILHGEASPETEAALNDRTHSAWQRIKFEELFAQQLALKQARKIRQDTSAASLGKQANAAYRAVLAALPFQLTNAQQAALQELIADMSKTQPMQRLLQGDVGSGKTVVAALACAQAVGAGFQAAFMAPTEILAEQHYSKLAPLFASVGIRCEQLMGATTKKEKKRICEALLRGEIDTVMGTHALIEESVQFKQLGLVIIDEQHRFGVEQRLALLKAKEEQAVPHQLMMTATPIPRTLAQTYLSDLDVSSLNEKPPGRQPILTKLLSQKRRTELYKSLHVELLAGKQVYWVCPLIEESETLQLQAAEQTYAELCEALPGLGIGLLHGRLSAPEKARIMQQFTNKELQLLVSTTVIEVGVDVPNATLMVIEHAERFGLAQLHQLRGRVGRGSEASVCILLFGDPLSWTGKQRLKAMKESNDGFWLAEKDLEIRGPGELLGKRQSGIPMLRYTDPLQEKDLVKLSRRYAAQVDLDTEPWAQRLISRWFGETAWWLS